MAEVKWIKLTVDMFDNRKIKYLRTLPEGNNIVLIWVMLLTIAGRCNAGGMIFLTENIPYDYNILADELGFDVNTVKLALEALSRMSMIVMDETAFAISNWEKYQNTDRLDKLREYQKNYHKEYRQKQKLLAENLSDEDKVSRKLYVNALDKEIDKDKDIKNKNNNITCSDSKFDLFWKEYPRKVGKEAARKAFAKVKVSVDVLIDAVKKQKESDQWKRGYIPNPATWLNQGRWEDDLSTMADTKKASLGIATVDQRHATHGFTPTEF